MYKNGFLLGLAMSAIMLVSLTISASTVNAYPISYATTGSLYHRQPDWTGEARISAKYHLDCFRRYYNFNHEKSSLPEQKDVSNYFMNLS